jgi:hypothetical protein
MIMKRTTLLGRLLICVALAGCAETSKPTTRPASMQERQDQAMKDPFGYSPSVKEDISGGGFNEFDKDAFGKDLKNVLDP